MSFSFLPNDVWIPSGPETWLNPMASVWLKTTLVNCLAVAPVIPLLHGWSLYVVQSSTSVAKKTIVPYRGTIDALLRTGKGLNVFRGSLPLFMAIPMCTGSSLAVSISALMMTANIDPVSSGFSTLGAVMLGETLVQPFRYWYFQRVVSQEPSLVIGQKSTYSNIYRGLGYAMVASAVTQLYPHFERYLGLDKNQSLRLPLYGIAGLFSYGSYVMAVRRMCTAEGEKAPTLARTLFGGSASILPRISFLFAGVFTMGAARALVSTLQTHMSAEAAALPF